MTDPPACSRCGASIAPGARFCPSCGLDVSGSQGGVATMNVSAPTFGAEALQQALRQATIGEYDVLGELGRGGMATVYLAHDIALDRKVAIKVMSPALFSGEGMAERFKREARTAGQLSHPHIIPIYAVKESGQLLFFVMKFVEGRPLDSIIREVGPLPIPMVQTILQQVGSALGYAHRRGVIHRDIKPPNIMIDADGWAVVTDFGIAKVSESQGLTVSGATIGTPSYMSPEQCAAKELSGASDQYSLGVVAYEMLSGRLPFTAESVMAVMYAHFNEPPSPIQLARTDCPPALAAAVMKMLEKEPGHRFPTVEAAVAAIGGAPLAPDDPIRTQMMTLAAQGESLKLLQRHSTPVSQPSVVRSEVGGSAVRPSVATVVISPARVSVAVGGAVQLLASPKTRRGKTVANRPVSWASTNTNVARVSANGLVTAVGPGTVTITASIAETSATAVVTVTAARSWKKAAFVAIGTAGIAGVAFGLWKSGLLDITPPVQSSTPIETLPSQPAGPPEQQASTSGEGQTESHTATQESIVPVPPSPRDGQSGTRQNDRRNDVDQADVEVAIQNALVGRAQAVDAGATVAELGPGDAERNTAQQLLQSGRRKEALQHLSVAATLWAATERGARSRADSAAEVARRRERDSAAQQRRESLPPSPPPVDPLPLIREAITAYARALEHRDLNALRQVYPGITSEQTQRWQALFESTREIQPTVQPPRVTASGDQAEADVSLTLRIQYEQGGRRETLPVDFHARLARQGTRWVITAIR